MKEAVEGPTRAHSRRHNGAEVVKESAIAPIMANRAYNRAHNRAGVESVVEPTLEPTTEHPVASIVMHNTPHTPPPPRGTS